MSYSSHVIETGDGRHLEVASVGDPRGVTMFFHHGTPGSAPLVRSFEESAESAGVFIVTTSRAGYGPSDRLEGRAVADVVPDVTAALDFFGRERYVSVGWSGGGPHALACGALDAGRCVGVVTLAGVAPADVDFDWTEGMGPENIEEFELARQGGAPYEEHMAMVASLLALANDDNIVELFGGLLSPVDAAALDHTPVASALAESCVHGLRDSVGGFIDDDQSFLRSWGFALRDVVVPTEVWFGDQDLMVPPSHGRYLVANLHDVRAEHFADDGHVSLANHTSRLMDHVVRLAHEG